MKLLPTLFLAAVCAASAPAFSQSAPAATKLTRDQLRTCLDNEPKIAARRAELDKRAEAVKVEGEEIQKEGDALKQEQKRVEDSAMPGVRDRFERKVKAYTARVENGNKSLAALRTDYETLQKDLNAHNENCSGKVFDAEDRDAILKEREGRK
jgi:Skp family chaperone for outer membrane proteins